MVATRTVSGVLDLPNSYLGQIATRCLPPRTNGSTSVQVIQTRTHHRSRDTVTSVSVGWGNWRLGTNGVGDVNNGGTATIKASVEYPAGTITPLTFSGASSATIAAGQTLISDAATISIPRGAKFFVRSLISNPSGVFYNQMSPVATEPNGPDTCEYSATIGNVTDKTLSGTISGTNDTWWPPLLILSQTTRPSMMLVGDSICQGIQETFDDGSSDLGVFARSIGQWFGYLNTGVSGESVATYLTTSANRRALLPYFSHVISQLGTNDIASGAATVLSSIETLGALFNGKRRLVCTLTPRSTSTDTWATVANQTGNATVIAINKGVRAGVQNWDGMIDLCSAIEAAPDSAKWDTTWGVVTTDGLHPQSLGSQLIRRSRVIHPGLFYR